MSAYYVYALKDPRSNPARPFYIGKGTGSRAWDHTAQIDNTRKGKRIAEINASGAEVVTTILVKDLSEIQAIKLEAELIGALGTEDTGGILTNSVNPTGKALPRQIEINIPSGAFERAQLGLELLKSSILELAKTNPQGITNSDTVKALGLSSNYLGGSKDYLTWSVIGILMKEGKLRRGNGSRKHFAQVR